jgi:hypothetical protein
MAPTVRSEGLAQKGDAMTTYEAVVRRESRVTLRFTDDDLEDGETPEQAALEIVCDVGLTDWDDIEDDVELLRVVGAGQKENTQP